MIRSPYTTKIERGGYSSIVFKDGDLYVAEDAVGTVFKENADAYTVVQKAIDDYGVYGEVLIKPAITLTTGLKITKANTKIKFLGKINSQGVDAIEIGDQTHYAYACHIEFSAIDGIDYLHHGVVFINTIRTELAFESIQQCDIGIYFNPGADGKCAENRIRGQLVGDAGTAAVRFSNSTCWMEGNHFETTIFRSPIGFDLISGGNSAYQTYIGVIDCCDTAGSEDIKDAVGHQLFICDFVRRDTCTIHKTTTVINPYGSTTDSDVIESRGGTMDMMNIGFTPLLMWDFNRDSVGDWTKVSCSMSTPSKSVTRITPSAANPYIWCTTSLDGGQAYIIIVRYKYVSGPLADAKVYYKTAGHNFSESYYKHAPNLVTDGEWHVLVMDMTDLGTAGSDWIDNTITGFRFGYASATTVYDIDYIAIGGRGYASIYHMDDALKTPASAGAVGNKGDIRWDASYIYICTATGTWKRAAISTW